MSWLKQHKWFYWLVAVLALLLGLIGVFLPLLPITPFLIVALWAASHCSPRLTEWLEGHPRFGPMLAAWQQHRAIPLAAKCLACGMLLLSFTVLWYQDVSRMLLGWLGLFMVLIMAYLLSRPSQ